MPKDKVYRLSFDFRTKEEMNDFFDTYVEVNLEPYGDVKELAIVEKDSLHPKAHEHLVRKLNGDNGNGKVAHFYGSNV
jgi:hypothetical protein